MRRLVDQTSGLPHIQEHTTDIKSSCLAATQSQQGQGSQEHIPCTCKNKQGSHSSKMYCRSLSAVDSTIDCTHVEAGTTKLYKYLDIKMNENDLPFLVQILQDSQRLHCYTCHILCSELLTLLVPNIPQAGPQQIHNLNAGKIKDQQCRSTCQP